jgi:hypothetical protein
MTPAITLRYDPATGESLILSMPTPETLRLTPPAMVTPALRAAIIARKPAILRAFAEYAGLLARWRRGHEALYALEQQGQHSAELWRRRVDCEADLARLEDHIRELAAPQREAVTA